VKRHKFNRETLVDEETGEVHQLTLLPGRGSPSEISSSSPSIISTSSQHLGAITSTSALGCMFY
jgi:hypothetical protein